MPTIDLSFRLSGTSIPADHGYSLYGALCHLLPSLHAPSPDGHEDVPSAKEGSQQNVQSLWGSVAVHPINGSLSSSRRLALNERSRLTLRLEATLIKDVMKLAGKSLALGEDEIRLGVPSPNTLKPSAFLYSRLVVIKGFMAPEPFLQAVKRQLETLGVHGVPELMRRKGIKALEGRTSNEPTRSPFIRRTIRIKDKEIVGFAVRVSGLSEVHSLILQEKGLGGRRRFGCGIFIPVKEAK